MKLHVSATALFLSISVASICSAILAGDSGDGHKQQATSSEKTNTKPAPTSASDSATTKLDSNSTFYYEADTFLLNEPAAGFKAGKASETNQKRPAAGHRAISGRNGRMLDLDELTGDLETARANKELRAQITSRQSRNLNGAHNLDLGGKRLHIQGFIPIVGIKDDQADEPDKSGSDELAEQMHSSASVMKAHQPRLKMLPTPGAHHQLSAMSGLDLPYGQSSLGHASFNVQRYLNTDNSAESSHGQYQLAATQPPSGRYTASIVDTLKKPIQKLTNTFGGSNNNDQQQHQKFAQQQQNCLCVPFYMCKNGYISESGLGRTQIQQMILQQQQTGQQPRQLLTDASSGRPGQVESVSPAGASYANSFVPVDERSNERELVTAPPALQSSQSSTTVSTMMVMDNFDEAKQEGQGSAESQSGDAGLKSGQDAQPNQAADEEMSSAARNSSLSSANLPPVEEMTTLNQQSDYSQDILGRMLGLKANSRVSMLGSASQNAPANQQQQSASGVCGLLRTCCNIPISLFPTQQQMQQIPLPQQQVAAVQRYQTPPVYGQQSHQLVTRAQAPVSVSQPSYESSTGLQPASLYHRISSDYPQQQQAPRPMSSAAMMGLPSTAVQQFARAPQGKQSFQTFQAPFGAPLSGFNMGSPQLMKSAPHNHHTAMLVAPSTAAQLGTRKLLEGRCGLRQSAGINGRVQNSAGGENSADFGEYPAQAAILKRLNGSESLFVCSGTLISQSWVATAAHCIKKHLGQGQLRVRLGEWDVHRDDEFYPYVEKEVRDLLIHPDFVAGNLINDIALVRLDSAVDPTLPHVNPACLPGPDESFARQRCWVAGWGKDAFGQQGAFQSVLQEVELPVLGHAECEMALRQTRLGPHYRLHPGFTCAGGEAGKDACEGDGGSGLYCAQEGVIKVAGLVSWGISCGQRNVPGVFVSMAHYRTWIENIIAIDDDIYSPYNPLPSTLISERSAGSPANATSQQTAAQVSEQLRPGDNGNSTTAAAATTATTTTTTMSDA